jgi:hypothetical protein
MRIARAPRARARFPKRENIMPGQTDEGSRTPMPEASHDLHPAAQPLCTTTRRDARLLPRSWTTLLPATAATPLSPLCHCRTASATCTPMTSHCCCLTAADHAAAASTRRLAATSPPSLPKPPLLVPPTPSSQQPSNNANDQAGRCHACHCHACHCHARAATPATTRRCPPLPPPTAATARLAAAHRGHTRQYPQLPAAATIRRCHRRTSARRTSTRPATATPTAASQPRPRPHVKPLPKGGGGGSPPQ